MAPPALASSAPDPVPDVPAPDVSRPPETDAGREAARSQDPTRQANLDPEDDATVAPPAPLEGCEDELRRLGAAARPTVLPERRSGTVVCGAPQVVTLERGPSGLTWSPPALVTCRLALALVGFETLLQQEAQRALGRRVTRVRHLGTYSCRRMAAYRLVSEHSYANGIDIVSVQLEGGKALSVLSHFGGTRPDPAPPEATLLRTVARRAYDEGLFSVVLTPFFDALHRDHFHMDLARYRVDGTR